MGSCVAYPDKKGRVEKSNQCIDLALKRDVSLMNSSEIHLLRLMFNDLAARSGTNKLSKDDFDIFFHLNGLWKQEVFSFFDENHNNQLSFENFKIGIQKLVKGSLRQKVHILFSFYDSSKTNRICYSDIVAMMLSYSKEELKKIFDNQNFIGSLNKKQKETLFGKHCFEEAKQIVEEWKTQNTSDTQSQQGSKSNTLTNKPFKTIKSQGNKIKKTLSQSSGSISHYDSISKRNIKISSNVSILVQKYVDFLFKEVGLNKETDTICQQQFIHFLSRHQQIFQSYYKGLHNYIWETNSQGIQTNSQIASWISSNCTFYNNSFSRCEKVFLKYIKSTIFIYKRQTDLLPKEIINLQGLQLEEIEENEQFGFILKHSSGNYPQKKFIFTEQSLFNSWLKHLNYLKDISFHQKYCLMQKIGQGNFSVVYRGIQRKTMEQVAIKVMQKQKLSSVQKHIVRHQCEVLKLCHHPCIVNYKQKVQSKTHIYLVTELLKGGDLFDYICQKGKLSERQTSFIMKQLLQTVQYLNTIGLIHRDIKSENIIIRKGNDGVERVKFIDFGFAVFNNSIESLNPCQKFVGTPGYSAPEIIRFQEYDGSVDNFSLGVLLHFMLSGQLPFDGSRSQDIKRRTLKGIVEMKGSNWVSVSQQAKDLVLNLLKPSNQRISIQQSLIHPWFQSQQQLLAAGVSKQRYSNN